MMLSDSGYGLLLFIGGTLLTRLKRPSGDFGKLVKVISMSGLSLDRVFMRPLYRNVFWYGLAAAFGAVFPVAAFV